METKTDNNLSGVYFSVESQPLYSASVLNTTLQEKKATDEQIGGNHYRDMPIQPIEFIVKNKLPFIEGNIIKYICRHRSKNKAEDIKKVIHYCKLLLELEYNEK